MKDLTVRDQPFVSRNEQNKANNKGNGKGKEKDSNSFSDGDSSAKEDDDDDDDNYGSHRKKSVYFNPLLHNQPFQNATFIRSDVYRPIHRGFDADF
jgi:hypothetical protein